MPSEANLTHRDILARDTFTLAENLSFALILIASNLAFWIADPRSSWVLTTFILLSILAIAIVKIHERTHPFFVDKLWRKFWLLLAPSAVFLSLYLIGFLQTPVSTVEIRGQEWDLLETTTSWLPITSSRGYTILTILGFCAVFLVAKLLFLIPKSRAYFERIIPWLCLSAALICLWGSLQESLDLTKPVLTEGTGQLDFFAFFPYDGHWAAFAILWSSACISMSLTQSLLNESPSYLHSRGPWFLAAGTMLSLSSFWMEAKWPAALLLINYGLLLCLVAFHFLYKSKDKDRRLIAISCSAAAIISCLLGVIRIFSEDTSETRALALNQAGMAMFYDKPIFGWGLDAFSEIAPYFLPDALMPYHFEGAHTSFVQLLAEFGLVGAFVVAALVFSLLLRYLRGKHSFHLSNFILLGCCSILALAFFDNPFMSPAVFFSFWLLLFSALRWIDLSRSNRVDLVDSDVMVVSDPKERRVPIFSGPQKEVHK